MANQITSNGTFTIGDSAGLRGTFNLSLNLTMTGSNLALEAANVPSGSWKALSTSSLSDLRYAVFVNSGTQKIILGASDVGAGISPVLMPGDFCVIPYSGSGVLPLYAQGYNSSTASLLEYGVAEE
jgi:hypothetical protein